MVSVAALHGPWCITSYYYMFYIPPFALSRNIWYKLAHICIYSSKDLGQTN
jgi:hypothetical protein